ncbi:MAG: hypothetical protein WCG31_01145 [Deltaproteobacteria bacterium]
MESWLIDESLAIDETALDAQLKKLTVMRGKKTPALAIRINDLFIYDTKKWFGSADIRLDALVIHGPKEEHANNFLYPSTYRFSGIKDGQRLPIVSPGQCLYYGHPCQFLDISIFVSRDTKDSDELATLLNTELKSEEWQNAASSVLALSAAAPQAAAIAAAVGGAVTLGNIAYKVMKNITSNTIGLYRVSWLQYRDQFGIGRHPETGAYREQDFSFWYEVVLDIQQDT